MSSVELLCSYARNVCSRGYKPIGRGCQTQVPVLLNVQFVSPYDSCRRFHFIVTRVRDKRGLQMCATMLCGWKVFSYVDVCQEALKGAEL
jgi:hypothetical protein